jgi:hypothetical protein
MAPMQPTWELEGEASTSSGGNLSDDENDEGGGDDGIKNGKKRKRMEEVRLNAKFADPNLQGVEACTDKGEIDRVREETQKICGWNGKGL